MRRKDFVTNSKYVKKHPRRVTNTKYTRPPHARVGGGAPGYLFGKNPDLRACPSFYSDGTPAQNRAAREAWFDYCTYSWSSTQFDPARFKCCGIVENTTGRDR